MKEVIHQNVDKIVTQGIHSNDGLPRTFEIDVWMDTLQNWNTSFSSKLDLTGGTLTGQLNTTDVKVGGNLEVTGDVTFLGNVTTISTETIELADNILLLNSNATTDEDGGIELSRGGGGIPNVSFKWDSTLQKWTSGLQEIQAAGFSGNLAGNATSADTWSAARDLTLAGAVTGNVSLDGSANATLTTTLTAHNHSIAEVDEVSILSPQPGEVLTYDTSGVNPVWVNKPIPAVTHPDFDQLVGVDLPAPADLDVLQYNHSSGNWEAQPLPPPPSLGELSNLNADVDSTTLTTHNSVLAYDSTFAEWKAKPISSVVTLVQSISMLNDVNLNTVTPGQLLAYDADFDGAGNSGWKPVDVYTKAVADGLLADKANAADVYDKNTVDTMVASAGFTPVYNVSTDANGDTVIDFTQP